MMCKSKANVIASLVLIGLGTIFLLQNFNVFGDVGAFFISGLFGLAAMAGFGFFFAQRKQWWVLFPSAAFLGIAGAAFADSFRLLEPFSGTFFFFGLSTAFWLIFISQAKHWWAGIPAGVLTSLGFTVLVDEFVRGPFEGQVFLIGLGLTFGMLWLLRRGVATAWAIWPAIVLLSIGLIGPVFGPLLNIAWPLALIGLGGWLVLKTLRGGQRLQPAHHGTEFQSHHNGHNGHQPEPTDPADDEVQSESKPDREFI